MAVEYATIDDVTALGRKLTADERDRAAALLPIASAKLRTAAKKYGKDIDFMIASDSDIEPVVREIIVKAVIRAVDASADHAPAAAQATQAALGYSVSMTYLNAGQALYFLRNELKELGLLRQKYGAMEVYGFGVDD